jgi:hypothetical protein
MTVSLGWLSPSQAARSRIWSGVRVLTRVREWIPISISPKGRLALAAVMQLGERRFDDVKVGELAAAADVTPGFLRQPGGWRS